MASDLGTLVEGRVVDIVKFGAFVKIRGGKTGLVHISQISDKFVREVSDYISIGTEVVAKIISIDDKGRVQLSLKDVLPEEKEIFLREIENSGQSQNDFLEPRNEEPDLPVQSQQHHFHKDDSFESKLKKFMRQSEDRLVDLKKSNENKRGGGKKRR